MRLGLTAHFKGTPTSVWLAERGLDKGGRVQVAIDNAVIRFSIPYCPMDFGVLAYSPYAASPPGGGEVIYSGPYAHYQYVGEVYGPNIPVFEDGNGEPTRFFSPPGQKKSPTGRALDYSNSQMTNGPLAGSRWFERMKADRLADIVKEAQDAVNNK